MTTMRAVVFRGKGQIGVEEVPKPVPGPGEAVIRITATTICGTDVHIVRGEYPGKPGLVLGHEPVGVIEELGAGSRGLLHGRRACDRRRDHALRPVLLLPERRSLAMRWTAWRLALWQHDQRRMGRVPARARCPRKPCDDPRRSRRRICSDVSGHLFHRAVWRRERQYQGRRRGRGFRAGPDRLVRDGRRETTWRRTHHRLSMPSSRGSTRRADSAPMWF